MLKKTYDVEVKADQDGETGSFTALASVFGNIDLVGDRVMPGAFTKTLRQLREAGDPLPIVMSHDWENPMAHIGIADPGDVKQTKRGLEVKGRLDIDTNDVAAQVYRLMKRRSLKSWSFGYTVDREELAEDGANELLEVSLVEAGPTLKGANPEAGTQSVKAALDAQSKGSDEPPPRTAPEPAPPGTEPQPDTGEHDAGQTSEAEEAPDPDSEIEGDDGQEPQGHAAPRDPLREKTNTVALEVALGRGVNETPPEAAPEPEAEAKEVPAAALRRATERAALEAALGGSFE